MNRPDFEEYQIKETRSPLSDNSRHRNIKLEAPSVEQLERYSQTNGSEGHSPLEQVVWYYFRRQGYQVRNLRKTSLRSPSETSAISSDNIGIVRKVLEKKLGDVDIEEVCCAGVPDLLVFKQASWTRLGQILPPIKTIKYSEEGYKPVIQIEKRVDKLPVKDLIDTLSVKFVEVKSRHSELSDAQKGWIRRFKPAFDIRLFRFSDYYYPKKNQIDRGDWGEDEKPVNQEIECQDCGQTFKNQHGLSLHHSKTECEPEDQGDTQ